MRGLELQRLSAPETWDASRNLEALSRDELCLRCREPWSFASRQHTHGIISQRVLRRTEMSDHDAVAGPEDLTNASEAQEPSSSFADNSYLSYLIPSKTDLDLGSAVEEAKEQGKPILESIEARDSLYFGESVSRLL